MIRFGRKCWSHVPPLTKIRVTAEESSIVCMYVLRRTFNELLGATCRSSKNDMRRLKIKGRSRTQGSNVRLNAVIMTDADC